MSLLSVERFGPRATFYANSRPGYPPALAGLLTEAARLEPGSAIADIGSGTGISSAIFLGRGFRVFAVEPNAAMRDEAERAYSHARDFSSIEGSAERVPLPGTSVRLITAGTAFHWFDHESARREFARLLEPGGIAAIFWNRRLVDDPFSAQYEQLLRGLPGYSGSGHRKLYTAASIAEFFGREPRAAEFPNSQDLDREALLERALSSSYSPLPDSEAYPAFALALREIFERHRLGGSVTMRYTTQVFFGPMEIRR